MPYKSMDFKDFDSDFVLTTNNETIVNVVKNNSWNKCYIPVNKVSMEKAHYSYNMQQKAVVDSRLASNTIGEITNKAQILVSELQEIKLNKDKYKDFTDQDIEKMKKIIIGLVVATNLSIDGAKRLYNLSLESYLKKINKDEDYKKYWLTNEDTNNRIAPRFFKDISQNDLDEEKKEQKYIKMDCNIDLIATGKTRNNKDYSLFCVENSHKENSYELKDLIAKYEGKPNENQIPVLLDIFKKYYGAWRDSETIEDYKLSEKFKEKCKKEISRKKVNIDTIKKILHLCWCDKKSDWTRMNSFIMEVLLDQFPTKFASALKNPTKNDKK